MGKAIIMALKKITYITTPLYYVNASPHIGHAYTQVACDCIARFLKQKGDQVFFMTGTDEHGEKIEKAALSNNYQKGQEKKFVDDIVVHFINLWKILEINYDFFIRTTDKIHKDTVGQVLETLYKQDDIYKAVYKGWFCTPCEMFWSDAQVQNGLCPDCKRPLEKLDEENYFFKLSNYQNQLIKIIEKNQMLIEPGSRRNEVLTFLKQNKLQDLCISRSKDRLSWGIELPFDKKYVAYVWVDALINYVSGIGYFGKKEKFKKLWPADLHIIGKDILRHHAIYWPAILLALKQDLPKKIFAHGWWVVGKEKMSKSKGNAVNPLYLLKEKKYPVDGLRYFLLSQVKFGLDGTFSEDLFIEKYNSDLANDMGNLLNRSLTMVEKYFDGIVPDYPKTKGKSDGEESIFHEELKSMINSIYKKVGQCMEIKKSGPDFQSALKGIWELIKKANKYIEVSAPWSLHKTKDTDTLKKVIYTLMQVLGTVALLIHPFMPHTSAEMMKQLGADKALLNKSDIKWGIVPGKTKIMKKDPLFPRIVVK